MKTKTHEMVSMKLTPRAAKAAVEPAYTPPPYPWGLSLTLDDEVLEKLGATRLPAVGAELLLHARVTVTRVEASESDERKTRSVSLQITALCLESTSTDAEYADVLFGAKA
jgi:hypothetical protein